MQTNLSTKFDGEYRDVFIIDPAGNRLGIEEVADRGLLLIGNDRVKFTRKWFQWDDLRDSAGWSVDVEGVDENDMIVSDLPDFDE